MIHVHSLPGFGLGLDEVVFRRAVAEQGFVAE